MKKHNNNDDILSGKLRHRITIERLSVSTDALGGQQKTWQALATIWADIKAYNGREILGLAMRTPVVKYRIIIRYRDDIEPDMRIIYDGKVLAIKSVADRDGNKNTLEIIAEEGVVA